MITLPVLGIDISKAKIDVTLIHNNKKLHKVYANDATGFALLAAWLKKRGLTRLHACLEATSSYGQAVAQFLHQNGHVVSIVNPARIKGFAQAELSRNKNDRIDSAIIARFCLSQRPEAWQPPAAEIALLQALLRRLENLEQLRQMEVKRLETYRQNLPIAASLNRVIRALEEEIGQVRQLIGEHIDQHPELKNKERLLVSIPGIGELTAAWLMSEINLDHHHTARQAAAHAGVTPQQKRSGSSVRGKTTLSKIGNARLRKKLYMPAIVAKNHNPIIQAFCERLKERGKHNLEIVGAAMRKLVHIAFGVLKSQKPFDPSFGS